MQENDIVIRKFKPEDKAGVRIISCETAFLDQPREYFIDDDEILADVLTSYYTDYEPESCFAALSGREVIGYIIGARDVSVMRRIFNTRIIPRLILKSFRKGLFFKKNALLFFMHAAISFFKREFFQPDFSKTYRATLHINIEERFRALHIGASLIESYLEYLKDNGVKGVRFGTISDKAKIFFKKMDFQPLYESKRSYLRYRLKRDVSFCIFGKIL